MKKLIYILLGCMSLAAWYGCKKDGLANDYKKFYNGHELTYTGAVGAVVIQPGNLAIGLKWKASSDPSITKYIVYYNNGADSQVVNITEKLDTVRTVIRNLQEYTYSFTIYSYDAKGNKSIPFEVNNAKAYGPVYAANLLNRAYNATTPYDIHDDGSVTLNFIAGDTIHTKTVIKYTNAAGVASTAVLLGTANQITLPSYKYGAKVLFRSSYIPERTAIDTFTVESQSEYPDIFRVVQCDKSLFKAISLPNDVHADFGTSFEKLWDGSVGPQGYPNIFHSNEAKLPHHFTFDMGAVYNNLVTVEETGRNQSHNPLDFEVWGIANINGAATTLQGTDPGWKAEMQAKGWTLLKECVRTDNGQEAMKFDLGGNTVPVRYIRIRVKTNASGENYSNISEFTFWNKQ